MARPFLVMLSIVLALFTQAATVRADTQGMFSQSYAVVIGINDYPSSSGMARLTHPKKDAEGMSHFLQSQGFQVKQLIDGNATKANIFSLLEDDIAPRLRENDRILFFFSGHGMTRELGGAERGYILPYDAQANHSSTWIDMDDIRGLSDKMGIARHQYFIMDACYGGQIGMKAGRGGLAPTHPNYIREVVSRPARQFLTAGGRDQQVQDGGPHGYSYFTGYLLEALEQGRGDLNGDGYITVDELETYIIPRAADHNQTPARGQLPGHGLGEFIFTTVQARAPDISSRSSDYVPSFKGGVQYPWDRSVQVAVKPSYNCAKASTYVEHLICDTPALTVVDRDLGKAYSNLRSRLSSSGRIALRDEQREWIQFRDDTCEKETSGLRFSDKQRAMVECIGNETWLRTGYLDDELKKLTQ